MDGYTQRRLFTNTDSSSAPVDRKASRFKHHTHTPYINTFMMDNTVLCYARLEVVKNNIMSVIYLNNFVSSASEEKMFTRY